MNCRALKWHEPVETKLYGSYISKKVNVIFADKLIKRLAVLQRHSENLSLT